MSTPEKRGEDASARTADPQGGESPFVANAPKFVFIVAVFTFAGPPVGLAAMLLFWNALAYSVGAPVVIGFDKLNSDVVLFTYLIGGGPAFITGLLAGIAFLWGGRSGERAGGRIGKALLVFLGICAGGLALLAGTEGNGAAILPLVAVVVAGAACWASVSWLRRSPE